MSDATPIIHWFRQDLRCADNPALAAAAAGGRPVAAVYVFDEAAAGAWPPGGASRWWLHYSLASLDQRLRALGSRLILRRGDTLKQLRDVARVTGARSVVFTRCYEPAAAQLEQMLKAGLESDGVTLKRYAGALLFEPETARTQADQPFRVFTPFWRACQAMAPPRSPLPAPRAADPT